MARTISVQIIGDARSFERATKKAGKAADSFAHKLHKTLTGGRMKNLARAGGLGGLFAGAGLLGGGVALGVSSFKAASEFEATLARIQGLAGQSQRQVKAWGDQLIRMGPALGKTPQELAEALYFIASSGVPASKAISVLTASTKAASAGLGDTQVVADAVTSVMNAYASSGMSAAHATDVLVATVREGKGEADQFAGVIGNVVAYSSKLKVPFEQVGAALAAMTQLGTDPATAATQLQAFFSSVLKTAPKVEKLGAKMGFSFAHLRETLASGDLRGALRYISDFARGHGGITSLAPLFPNIRALRAVLALGGTRVGGVFGRMGHSAGSTAKAFAIAAKTSKHHMDQLHAAVESLKIAFGQGLAPVVAKAANALANRIASPGFIERVRKLGFLIGNKLYNGFVAIKNWLVKNWPTIRMILQQIYKFAQKIVREYDELRHPLRKHRLPLKSYGDYKNLPGFAKDQLAARGYSFSNDKKHHFHIYLDGKEVTRQVTKNQQRSGRSAPHQTRGRHGGNALAIPG